MGFVDGDALASYTKRDIGASVRAMLVMWVRLQWQDCVEPFFPCMPLRTCW
jgi:hypothetical protein